MPDIMTSNTNEETKLDTLFGLPVAEPYYTNDQRDTVTGCYRVGDLAMEMATLVHHIGRYDEVIKEEGLPVYRWRGKDGHTLWLQSDGTIHVSLKHIREVDSAYGTEPYYAIIGWCVADRIPCILHDVETSRRAWRP